MFSELSLTEFTDGHKYETLNKTPITKKNMCFNYIDIGNCSLYLVSILCTTGGVINCCLHLSAVLLFVY